MSNSYCTDSQTMHSYKWMVAVLLAMSVAACGEPKPPPSVKDTVFGDLVATKEKAKQKTEQAMEQSKEQLDEAMKKVDEPDKTQ